MYCVLNCSVSWKSMGSMNEEGSFCILCVRFTDSAQTIRVVSHLYRQITIA